jgi:hypothetical protein
MILTLVTIRIPEHDTEREWNGSTIDMKLSLPLHEYSGTYSDPGYGNFTLCDPSDHSDYCKKVLSDFKPFRVITSNTKSLFAAWPRAWLVHLQLLHLEANKFSMKITNLYPHGYGKDTSAFEQSISLEEDDSAFVEFVVRHGKVVGCGFFGTIGQGTERERTGVTVEERADVWFERVGLP